MIVTSRNPAERPGTGKLGRWRLEDGSPVYCHHCPKVSGKDRKVKLNFIVTMDSKGHRIVVCDNGTGVRILSEFCHEFLV